MKCSGIVVLTRLPSRGAFEHWPPRLSDKCLAADDADDQHDPQRDTASLRALRILLPSIGASCWPPRAATIPARPARPGKALPQFTAALLCIRPVGKATARRDATGFSPGILRAPAGENYLAGVLESAKRAAFVPSVLASVKHFSPMNGKQRRAQKRGGGLA